MKRILLILLLIFPLFVFAKEEVKYKGCVDGDTIKVIRNKEEITVRLLAIDTPESVHPTKKEEYYGKESSEYTCNSIKNAKKIELEYDPKSDEKDKYGRVLAFVFVDDYLLEDILVRNGYAEVAYIYADYKYVDILREHETLAKVEKLGIWNEEAREAFNNKKDDVNIWLLIILIIIGLLYPTIKKRLKKYIKKSKIKLGLNLKEGNNGKSV